MEPAPGARAERYARLLVLSVGTTTLGGMLVGSLAFHAVSSDREQGWRQLLQLPVTMLLSTPLTLPLGLVSGLVAAVVLELLLRTSFRAASRRAWIGAGGAAGLVLGGLCPLFLRAIGFGIDGPRDFAVFGGFGASTGTVCGLLLGWLGSAEARRRASGAVA